MNNNYGYRVGIAVSVLVNVILGGPSNQTFSARNYARKKQSKFNMVRLIDWVCGDDHCLTCWTYWVVRKDKW